MSREATLRQMARAAIRDRRLPDRRPDRTWGGRGCGAKCIVCGAPVGPHEFEYEMEFTHDRGRDEFHAHVRCFQAWQVEQTI